MNIQGDNMASVKRGNRGIILNLLHRHGEMSRKRLAEKMKLSPAAITLITGEMINEGLLCECHAQKASGNTGRREVPLKIAYSSFVALGISLNLSEAVLSATMLNGKPAFSQTISINSDDSAHDTAEKLSKSLLQLTKKNNIDSDQVIGLGIAVRGVVDVEGSHSIHSFGTFKEKNVPLRKLFSDATNLPVTLDNNVRSMFRSHIFFTNESYSSQIFVRCERGIGGAISIDGQLLLGSRGMCAELGHVPVFEQGGKLCFCGKHGCLETISSTTAIMDDVSAIFSKEKTPLLHRLTGGHFERINLPFIFKAASDGDLEVDSIIQNAASKLSHVLKTITYAIDPGEILLYGSIFEHEYYLESLHKHFARGSEPDSRNFIKKCSLNLTLEDKSACVIAIERFFADGGIIHL